jgi:indole-3-acetate monooxygenase
MVLTPSGDGEWNASGDWEYETGCLSATAIAGRFTYADGDPARVGLPYVMLMPEEVRIERTWDPIGMRGTGSNRVVARSVTVPASRILYLVSPEESRFPDHPLGKLGAGLTGISLAAATTLLGVARRALDEARSILEAKPESRMGESIAIEHPRVLVELTQAEGRWWQARDGFERALDRLWVAAVADGALDQRENARARLAAVTAAGTAVSVVRAAFELCGTSSTVRNSPLERCFRDATTMASHTSVRVDTLAQVGPQIGLVPLERSERASR